MAGDVELGEERGWRRLLSLEKARIGWRRGGHPLVGRIVVFDFAIQIKVSELLRSLIALVLSVDFNVGVLLIILILLVIFPLFRIPSGWVGRQ